VLFVEGEELRGGKQHRVLASSVLAAGRSGTRLPVACVEPGRWHCGSTEFASGSCCPPSMRRVLKDRVIPAPRRSGGPTELTRGMVSHFPPQGLQERTTTCRFGGESGGRVLGDLGVPPRTGIGVSSKWVHGGRRRSACLVGSEGSRGAGCSVISQSRLGLGSGFRPKGLWATDYFARKLLKVLPPFNLHPATCWHGGRAKCRINQNHPQQVRQRPRPRLGSENKVWHWPLQPRRNCSISPNPSPTLSRINRTAQEIPRFSPSAGAKNGTKNSWKTWKNRPKRWEA
jgi:hypothetical protein